MHCHWVIGPCPIVFNLWSSMTLWLMTMSPWGPMRSARRSVTSSHVMSLNQKPAAQPFPTASQIGRLGRRSRNQPVSQTSSSQFVFWHALAAAHRHCNICMWYGAALVTLHAACYQLYSTFWCAALSAKQHVAIFRVCQLQMQGWKEKAIVKRCCRSQIHHGCILHLWLNCCSHPGLTAWDKQSDRLTNATQTCLHSLSVYSLRNNQKFSEIQSISISYLTKSKTVISCLCLCLTQVLKWSNPVQSSTGLSHSNHLASNLQVTSYKFTSTNYNYGLRLNNPVMSPCHMSVTKTKITTGHLAWTQWEGKPMKFPGTISFCIVCCTFITESFNACSDIDPDFPDEIASSLRVRTDSNPSLRMETRVLKVSSWSEAFAASNSTFLSVFEFTLDMALIAFLISWSFHFPWSERMRSSVDTKGLIFSNSAFHFPDWASFVYTLGSAIGCPEPEARKSSARKRLQCGQVFALILLSSLSTSTSIWELLGDIACTRPDGPDATGICKGKGVLGLGLGGGSTFEVPPPWVAVEALRGTLAAGPLSISSAASIDLLTSSLGAEGNGPGTATSRPSLLLPLVVLPRVCAECCRSNPASDISSIACRYMTSSSSSMSSSPSASFFFPAFNFFAPLPLPCSPSSSSSSLCSSSSSIFFFFSATGIRNRSMSQWIVNENE